MAGPWAPRPPSAAETTAGPSRACSAPPDRPRRRAWSTDVLGAEVRARFRGGGQPAAGGPGRGRRRRADLLGFQRRADAANFLRACRRAVGLATRGPVVRVPEPGGHREIQAAAFPISIAYQMLRDEVEVMVGRINGEYGQVGYSPVHYLHQSYPREEMAALYLAGDVMLVNPHDIEGLKDTIVRAAATGPAEARRRMRSMRRRVREHDVARWAADFLNTLREKGRGNSPLPG